MLLFRLLVVLSLALALAGCNRSTLGEKQPSPTQQVSPDTGTRPQDQRIDRQKAIDLVLALPEVKAYKDELKAKGYAFSVDSYETPSRFVVQVGEDRGNRVTVTDWYVVNKADGTAVKWDLSKGPVPKD